MHKALATLAFALLVGGWFLRRDRRRHVPLMLAGIGLDLALVVALELQRSVIAKAAGEKAYDVFEMSHILTSSAAVVLYLPTLYLGWKLWRGTGTPGLRRWHVRIASAALALRTVGFALMWTI